MKFVFNLSHFLRKVGIFSAIRKQHVKAMSTLESLNFDNLVLRRLPLDSEERNYVRTVKAACFSKVMPTPVDKPSLVVFSKSAMSLLGLPESEIERKEFVEYFSGNQILPGSEPAAHCYCGHQFGYFSGQLGDGAAIYLGEVINEKGERWELQLKGAGKTPFSRTADGRKVLRSSIREFLCSEAMHFLGIPTTRAGCCITSDSKVVRDIFYDGHPIQEKCTIVSRIAPTFLRFGSFEIFKTLDQVAGRAGPSVGRIEMLHSMLDYVIETFYPEIHTMCGEQVDKYAAFYKEVVIRTAKMVAHWMAVGFCHGVLNTDNMSILGLTLDYGPFGFLDMYDPNHICNGSDNGGRYSYIKQPEICYWNLQKFAEAIQKALPLTISLPLLELYVEETESSILNKYRSKLGLIKLKLDEDQSLVDELMSTMDVTGADFTNTFCCFLSADVSDYSKVDKSIDELEQNILKQCYPLEVIKKCCNANLLSDEMAHIMRMLNSNPELLTQLGRSNQVIQNIALKLEKTSKLNQLTAADKFKNDQAAWRDWLEKYKLRVRKEMEACDDLSKYNTERLDVMQHSNPRFILRNYIAQNAIDKAEKGDFSEVRRVMQLLESPYEQSPLESVNNSLESVNLKYDSGPSTSIGKECLEDKENLPTVYDNCPEWAFSLKVT